MNTTEQAARTLWDYDNADQSPEWREMAWNDMGGSERSEERVEYELRARALAEAGLLAPAPLREAQAEPWTEYVPLDLVNRVMGSLMFGGRDDLILSNEVNALLGASARRRAEGDGGGAR